MLLLIIHYYLLNYNYHQWFHCNCYCKYFLLYCYNNCYNPSALTTFTTAVPCMGTDANTVFTSFCTFNTVTTSETINNTTSTILSSAVF